MNVFSQHNILLIALFFSFCSTTTVVQSAAVSSDAMAPRPPSYGAIRIWQGLSEKQKLATHQAFLRTGLHTFPPGLVPLILDYIGSYTSFLVTPDHIRYNPENKNLQSWLGNCPKPFTALDPFINLTTPRPILNVYWFSEPESYRTSPDLKRFALTMANQATPNTQVYSPVSVNTFAFRSSTNEMYNHHNFAFTTNDGPEPSDATMHALDVCIPDYDPVVEGGARIEGCFYTQADHEVRFALTYASSLPMTREDLEVLETAESKIAPA